MNFFMVHSLAALVIGVVLDLIFGDPHLSWHPVCLIGKMICFLEHKLRRLFHVEAGCRCRKEILPGALLVLIVLFISTGLPVMLLWAAYHINVWLGVAAEAVLCYFMLAAKSLKDESMKVYDSLRTKGLEEGRTAVSMIVGRDTARLDEKGVVKAAVETIAENFSDGVAAPMFYMVLGGAGAMYFYKAVNTMDSMLGYKNDTYYYFGRVAAKLDDAANYIPARLSAVCMMIAAAFTGLDGKNAVRIYRRDRRKHASPNSAQTEAVAAGALRVQLAGDAWYFGELYHKEFIGDALRPIETEDIRIMNRLMYASSFVALVIFGGIKLCICMAVIFTGM